MRARRRFGVLILGLAALALLLGNADQGKAGVIEYGNENVLGTGTFPSDPKAGATLQGLAPNVITDAALTLPHNYPFTPGAGDFPGTDQIYVGSVQTASHDGYSGASSRLNGPQVLTLNYASLIPPGQKVATLTLGIASDDFQFPPFGQPFTAQVNGSTNAALTDKLNSVDESGPVVHFFTIGIDPAILNSTNVLTLSINEGGDGGDGWAVDFLTVGVTTTPIPAIPEPSTLALLSLGGLVLAGWRRWKSKSAPA
jgi:PEP-CTERM motif